MTEPTKVVSLSVKNNLLKFDIVILICDFFLQIFVFNRSLMHCQLTKFIY